MSYTGLTVAERKTMPSQASDLSPRARDLFRDLVIPHARSGRFKPEHSADLNEWCRLQAALENGEHMLRTVNRSGDAGFGSTIETDQTARELRRDLLAAKLRKIAPEFAR